MNNTKLESKTLTTIAFVIGLALIDNLSSTEQNAVGNWIMLIAQTLCTNGSYNFKITRIKPSKLGQKFDGIEITQNKIVKGVNKYVTFKIFTSDITGTKLGFAYNSESTQNVWQNAIPVDTFIKHILANFSKFLAETTNVNISQNEILNDNTTSPTQKEGFFKHKDGKLIIDIDGTEIAKFDSYNDFLLKGDLVKVNLKKSKDGSNFQKFGNNVRSNQKLYVNLPTNTNRTITTQTTNLSEYDVILDNVDKNKYSSLKETIESNQEHKGITVFHSLLGETLTNDYLMNEDNIELLTELLPNNFYYDNRLNTKHNNVLRGSIAVSKTSKNAMFQGRHKNGTIGNVRFRKDFNIVVGPRWMNLASSNLLSKRQQAIRKLIHENLHIKFREGIIDRPEVLNSIEELYNEVISILENDIKNEKNSDRLKVLKQIKSTLTRYVGKERDRRLEEFVIETFTNKTIFNYLNSKETSDVGTKGKGNLLTKLLNYICKLFNWTVKNNTLLKKEINLISNVLDNASSPVEETVVVESNTETNINTEETILTQSGYNINDEVGEGSSIDEIYSDETNDGIEEGANFDINALDEYEDEDSEDEENEYGDESIDEEAEENIDNIFVDINNSETSNDGFIQVKHIDAFVAKLPTDLQAQFAQMLDLSDIETKCW